MLNVSSYDVMGGVLQDLGLRRMATPEDYTHLFQVQMVLMFEWAEKLPEFCLLLDPMDKVLVLRMIICLFLSACPFR